MQYEIYYTYFVQKVEGTENKTVANPKSGGHVPIPGICTHCVMYRQRDTFYLHVQRESRRHVNKEPNTDPSFGSDGFFLAGGAFADGLTSPQLFADDTVSDDESCQRSNVVDNKQQNCVSAPTHPLIALMLTNTLSDCKLKNNQTRWQL